MEYACETKDRLQGEDPSDLPQDSEYTFSTLTVCKIFTHEPPTITSCMVLATKKTPQYPAEIAE